MSNHVFALVKFPSNEILGIYKNKTSLQQAVEYWSYYLTRKGEKVILQFLSYDTSYINTGVESCDWAYVSSQSLWKELVGCRCTPIPRPEWLDKNLIGENWSGVEV